MHQQPVHRVVDLTDPAGQQLVGTSVEAARALLATGPPEAVLGLRGSFALVAREGDPRAPGSRVFLARSLDRPLRFFLAKEPAGPMLVVAERIDAIRDCLEAAGYGHQFHPGYTRMVPAHHVTTLELVGCPDPQPTHARFFAPAMATLPPDLDVIGEHYVGALLAEVREWLATLPPREPIGVLFSGGADSTAVLLAVHHGILARGESAARLKAFTLAVDGGGSDLAQARSVLEPLGLGFLLEELAVPCAAIDPLRAVEVIEDYRPLDVECAAVLLALLDAIRERYPEWKHLADGDGGDENLKDYPIEEDPELTIRSVVNNRMLYQEGWGVGALKHSLVYSGGHSRGCVRGWAPARRFGFLPFSPFTRPSVVAVAEAIPFAALTGGSHERLYALKGEVLGRGLRRHLGVEVAIPPKRRFQHGAGGDALAARLAHPEALYRAHFAGLSAAETAARS